MVSLARYLGCFTGLILTACPPPPVDLGPGPEKRAPDLCEQACKRWLDMGCPEGEPVCDKYEEPAMTCVAYISCEEWCQYAEKKGAQPLNLQCIVSVEANDCEELEDSCAF